MKKDQRTIYALLASELDWGLCSFCKYHDSGPGSICDGGGDNHECTHPLSDRINFPWWDEMPMPGDDCWLFRPAHKVEFCADIIGACLANRWNTCQWWLSSTGVWKIYGIYQQDW